MLPSPGANIILRLGLLRLGLLRLGLGTFSQHDADEAKRGHQQ